MEKSKKIKEKKTVARSNRIKKTVKEENLQKLCKKATVKKHINYGELFEFIPDNENEENYALLTHYLMMDNGEQKQERKKVLIKKYGFNEEAIKNAETFYKTKKIPFAGPKKKVFTFIDLFAGIGGFRLAMQNNGGKCVFSSEWDDAAKQTYYENYGEVPFGDITKIKTKDIPDFDILAGGFPCQPFSSIGKREGFQHKTQGTLFFYIAEIIKEKKPKAFILENVTGLLTHDDGKTYETIIDVLENELNYAVTAKVLNSADFGVPQERKRLYFVGFRKDIDVNNFVMPEVFKNHVGIGQFVETDAEGPSISKHLQESYIFKKDDGHPEIIDSNSDFPVKTLCASYHKIQRITGTFVRGGKTGLRLLTENECKAIMGFPKNFIVPVSRTQMYHQFGNSIAVPVVIEIAKKMKSCLFNKDRNV